MSLLENEAVRSFVTWGTVCVVKMLAMGPLTARQRFKTMVFANPEDNPGSKKHDAPAVSENVERVRRCHLNDLENIPAFLALGAMLLVTNPSATIAIWHFRIFAVSRLLHTVCYLNGIQPFRALCYMVGTSVNLSMAGQILYCIFAN
ncbi:microsomal glutathione S-transferase 1-like [Ptychodera flava]|uniref:microsomal glutathione S-transferase 1-like n=1 Tax=Ptychodera flava TaxID=63121 RepID=UPI00396A1F04